MFDPPHRLLMGLSSAAAFVLCVPIAAVQAETFEIKVVSNSFQPKSVTVKAGDTVRWSWEAGGHSVTSGAACASDGKWDTGVRDKNYSFSRTFDQPGTYPYFCVPHCASGMTGSITVDATTTPPPTPNPTPNPTPTPIPNPTPTPSPPPEPTAQNCSEANAVNQNPMAAGIGQDPTATASLKTVVGENKGLVAPNWGIAAPGDKRYLYIVDTIGKLWAVDPANGRRNLALDLSALLVTDLGKVIPSVPGYDERGFLGVAFHPNYRKNGLVYTFTSEPFDAATPADFPLHFLVAGKTPDHRNVISEWRVRNPKASKPKITDPRRVLMRIDHPNFNHNGGALSFGSDGMLYVALGDGGRANDQDPIGGHNPTIGNGQDRQSVLGKILRIDPDQRSSANGQYGVPGDNPFAAAGSHGGDGGCGDGQCDEVWALGFRNPYRFSHDSGAGDLFVGDVGQNKIEEIDRVTKGGNYGWRYKEGSFFFQPNGSDASGAAFISAANCLGVSTSGLIDPFAQYDHDEGIAITGGFVYRGKKLAKLKGDYVFGDYSRTFGTPEGRLFRIPSAGLLSGGSAPATIIEFRLKRNATVGFAILGFGRDAKNELYVLGNTAGVPVPRDTQGNLLETGVIRKLVPATASKTAPPAPTAPPPRY